MMNLRYANADGLLIPGAMVRVRTNPVKSEIVTAVPQTAVAADCQGDYVYVIKDDTASLVRVTLGRDFGELREVTAGLTEGQKVVVAGIQNLRNGVKVRVGASGTQKAGDGGNRSEEAK
jgi:membrane fusion protein (multidrug efflux system)